MEAVGQPDRLVREAVDLGQLAARRRRDPADHHPAARRAEVDGRDEPAVPRPCSPQERRRDAGVDRDVQPGRLARGRRRSSAKTAAATCSGRTSRLSSVRCA